MREEVDGKLSKAILSYEIFGEIEMSLEHIGRCPAKYEREEYSKVS